MVWRAGLGCDAVVLKARCVNCCLTLLVLAVVLRCAWGDGNEIGILFWGGMGDWLCGGELGTVAEAVGTRHVVEFECHALDFALGVCEWFDSIFSRLGFRIGFFEIEVGTDGAAVE